MKIYTKTGDNGTTGLFAGPRVAKDDSRIAAYGAVDELNAVLGIAVATMGAEVQFRSVLVAVQSDLFSIGAELATPEPEKHDMCLLTDERIASLEKQIDEFDAELPPLSNFVLPGGSLAAAQLHAARTVCRRAERDVVHLSHVEGVYDCGRVIVYLNRLSDLLFVMARLANQRAGIADLPWNRQP
ncbi:MAG: cob(I)yrinic acid a,c-diamide adenosyltransferase [Pirellulaceae bacterium]